MCGQGKLPEAIQEREIYSDMSETDPNHSRTEWFAIKTRQDFRAEEVLSTQCDEVYFPKETIRLPEGKTRIRAVIPHVLFIRTTRTNALSLEAEGRKFPDNPCRCGSTDIPMTTESR